MKILVLHDESPSGNAISSNTILAQLQELGTEHQLTLSLWPIDDLDVLLDVLKEAELLLLCANEVAFEDLLRLRQVTRLPLLLITSTVDEETILRMYAIGVDDHLVPPMSVALLAAKLRVWQRWVKHLSSAQHH